MEIADLKNIAERARFMRESGFAFLLASAVLALFLLIPLTPRSVPVAETSVPTTPDAFASVPMEAKAAIVYDLATGEALFEKNADSQLPLASLTKLLAVHAALSALSPEALVTIPEEVTKLDYPRAFSTGQIFTLGDIAKLTLVASLNDGAAAITEAAAAQMNRTQTQVLAGAAAALGLSGTYAVNGSGLDVTEMVSGGYGNARDLAKLAGALVNEAPGIALATTLDSATAQSRGGTSFTVKNTNPMVNTVPRLLLSKTGYTDLAGGNLALVFDAGIGHPVAVIVLGSTQKERFTDASALVAATLAHFAGVKSL